MSYATSNPEIITESSTIENDMRLKIYNKFVELSDKYYKKGNYIKDLKIDEYVSDDKFTKQLAYDGVLNIDYKFDILEYIVIIDSFNISKSSGKGIMKKTVWKPFEKVGRSEFEDLFGFGIGGTNYNAKKQIIIYPKFKLYNFNEVKEAMMNTSITDTYLEQLRDLMLYGGYINNMIALEEMEHYIETL